MPWHLRLRIWLILYAGFFVLQLPAAVAAHTVLGWVDRWMERGPK